MQNENKCLFKHFFISLLMRVSLREKCQYLELAWSVFSRIRTEYKCEEIRTRITPNTDTFHAVYRKGFSAQLALLSFMKNWKKALENKGFCGAVLTDLSKTSNSINHDLFIKKPHEYRAISNFLLLVT